VLKVVGAVYLMWLGVQTLRASARSRRASLEDAPAAVVRRPGTYLRQGFLANALNPKVALFFVTFLPQFLSADTGSPRVQALVLSSIFAALYLTWFGLYVAVVNRLATWLRRPAVKARVEQVTGLVLVSVATRLATAHH
jgi:threonine/homoserine/homoserine lactone efflux protein